MNVTINQTRNDELSSAVDLYASLRHVTKTLSKRSYHAAPHTEPCVLAWPVAAAVNYGDTE